MRPRVVAEFDRPDDLLRAARRMREHGCRRLQANAPYRIDGLDEALGLRRTRIPVFALGAAVTGLAVAYLILWFCNAYDYPINVGGRPANSVPAHVPIMFETAVLLSSLTTFVLCLAFSRLPRLHFPMSEVEGFERTSIDRFWLAVDRADPVYDEKLDTELAQIGALRVRVIGGEAS